MDGYVKNMIRNGGKGGGYILSSACSVAPGVDPAILKTLVPLAEKYGRY
jgi:uroporphyrinogen-III decarboxylase